MGKLRDCVLASFAVVAAARAGVIQGIVLEQASGLPLARTQVRLDPVPDPGKPVPPVQTMTNRTGGFIFPAVSAGLYLVSCRRAEYFPAAYGQRRPSGQGTAVQVTADSTLFAELRMRRMGAITGRVLDENGVGIADVGVVAYRARLPLRISARATSDDRGFYRIHGLDPGKYWVRTAPSRLVDGSEILPTFGFQGRDTREARVVAVQVDSDSSDADIRPEFGRLFRLTGTVVCTAGEAMVALASDTGRRFTRAACGTSYRFEGLSPGAYEVFATLPDNSQSGFVEMFLDKDSAAGTVQLVPNPEVQFEARRPGSNSPVKIPFSVSGRRQDLAEADTTMDLNIPRATLSPGYWELRATVGPGQYVESISTGLPQVPREWRKDRAIEWFEVSIQGRAGGRVFVTVSDQAGQITGNILSGSKPIPGVPVFLWPVAEAARRSLGGFRQALSDAAGVFTFVGLTPGDYRMLATFDYSPGEIDADLLDLAQARAVTIAPSQNLAADIAVWTAP
jgi:hypothetical protein